MPSLNKAQIMGHAGGDAVIRSAPDGDFATFSLSTSNGKDKPATWWKCTAWKKQAEWCKGISKGDLVYCEGKVSLNEWKTKEGKEMHTLQLTVYDVKTFKRRDAESATVDEEAPIPF